MSVLRAGVRLNDRLHRPGAADHFREAGADGVERGAGGIGADGSRRGEFLRARLETDGRVTIRLIPVVDEFLDLMSNLRMSSPPLRSKARPRSYSYGFQRQ